MIDAEFTEDETKAEEVKPVRVRLVHLRTLCAHGKSDDCAECNEEVLLEREQELLLEKSNLEEQLGDANRRLWLLQEELTVMHGQLAYTQSQLQQTQAFADRIREKSKSVFETLKRRNAQLQEALRRAKDAFEKASQSPPPLPESLDEADPADFPKAESQEDDVG